MNIVIVVFYQISSDKEIKLREIYNIVSFNSLLLFSIPLFKVSVPSGTQRNILQYAVRQFNCPLLCDCRIRRIVKATTIGQYELLG